MKVSFGLFTRKHFPAKCKGCKFQNCTFDEKRKMSTPDRKTNPDVTPCDYCCVWKGNAKPDHFEEAL